MTAYPYNSSSQGGIHYLLDTFKFPAYGEVDFYCLGPGVQQFWTVPVGVTSISAVLIGGGGGGYRNNDANATGTNGLSGGSGGGSHTNTSTATLGGSSTKNDYSNWISLGNSGGRGISFGSGNPNNKHLAGGGGGAGSVGVNAYLSDDKNIGYAGNGGSGVNLSSIFGTSVGVSGGLFAGGGGGSYYGASSTNLLELS